MRHQIRPVALPHLRTPHLLPRHSANPLRVLSHMRIVALRCQIKPLLFQRAQIHTLRKPRPLKREIGVLLPALSPPRQNIPPVPSPVLETPIPRAQIPKAQHHMRMRIAVPLVVNNPVRNHPPRREGRRHIAPHQRHLRRPVQHPRKRNRQASGKTGRCTFAVQTLFPLLNRIPQSLAHPRPGQTRRIPLRNLPSIRLRLGQNRPFKRHLSERLTGPVRGGLRQRDLRMHKLTRLLRIVPHLPPNIRPHPRRMTIRSGRNRTAPGGAGHDRDVEMRARHAGSIQVTSKLANFDV